LTGGAGAVSVRPTHDDGEAKMDREYLKNAIQGPIATVPTPFDDDFNIDYGVMADLTKWWVDSGLVMGTAVIKVAAAMGEGPMLADDEWPHLLRTVVQAADDKASIVCGLHYKDTKRTIEDAKQAEEIGAVGLQVSPPIFNLPSQDDLLDFYSELSDATGIGILVYVTAGMNCPIDLDTYRKMADFENIVGIKWSTPPEGASWESIYELSDTFNIIDNSKQPARSHQLGGRGYINMTSEIHPPHDLKVWELLEAKKYDEAKELFDSVNDPIRHFYDRTSERSGGQARVKKGLMEIVGRPVGASRPPSKPLNAAEMKELRGIVEGFGWPTS
jgi:4-hydroxy-tetrahydrodipicolinate synthase